MKQRPLSRFGMGVLSFVLVTAWLLASNHCVVAGLLPALPPAKSGHEHCPGHAPSPQQKKSSGCGEQNCCKSLSAPAHVLAKNPISYDKTFFVSKDFLDADSALLGEGHEADIFELDTGPPAGTSFAESVLQRSLLAHAPPV